MHDLIFVSLEDWDEVWRRNQFLCAGLARRFLDRKILFVGLPRDVSHGLRHGRLGALRAAPLEAVPEFPNVTLLHPLKVFPNTLPWGRRANESLMRRQVRRAASALGVTRPLLWLNPHSAVHMAGRMRERAVVYDITDDWISPIQSGRMRRLITAQDAALCRRADAVIVCSQKLYDMKRDMARSLHLIPNGVDAEHYRSVLDTDGPCLKRRGVGTALSSATRGPSTRERVDVALAEQLARFLPARGRWPSSGRSADPPTAHGWTPLGNVARIGAVPYRRLPGYLRAFDVCITPHCMSEFTESLNPIKLWEYLAAGKPIVSTDVAGFRDYPHLVRPGRHAGRLSSPPAGRRCGSRPRPEWPAGRRRKNTPGTPALDCVLSVLDGLSDAHEQRPD